MKFCFPLSKSQYCQHLRTSSHESRQRQESFFYEDLDSIIQTTLTSNKFVILGNFNTRMGANSGNWDRGLGQHGVGKIKGNNMLPLSTYAKYNLCNTNMMFRLAKKFRTTWMHPRSNTGIFFAMSQYVS